MDNNKFIQKCITIINDYLIENEIVSENEQVEIYVVWLCKTLQNNKALLSTNIKDGRYYEITYNGDKNEFYFDSYKKEANRSITFNY